MKKLLKIVMAIGLVIIPLFTITAFAQETETVENPAAPDENTDNPFDHIVLPKGIALPSEEDLSIVPEDGLGNVHISLTDSKTEATRSKADIKFGLNKVADVTKGQYVLCAPYEEVDVDLNHIEYANELEEATAKLMQIENEPDQTAMTNEEGKTDFNNLEVGVYLIYAMEVGEYTDKITPFIVSIPSWNDADEVMMYDINIFPKHEEILETVAVTKYDVTTQKELPGAHLKVTDMDGNVIDEWVSTEKQHLIENLVVSREYTLTETIAPKNYKLAQSITFKVEDNGKVYQQIKMYDELLGGGSRTSTQLNEKLWIGTSVLACTVFGILLYRRKKS